MNNLKQKLAYLGRCIAATGQKKACPFCGGNDFSAIDAKFFGVARLLKCRQCGLQHRHPKDSEAFLKKFYQTDYKVDVALMTDLPDAATLSKLKSENFPGQRDYSAVVKAASKKEGGIKLIDYGCSWGYNVFKLRNAGIDASGYELSAPRAAYGREHLGINLTDDEADIAPNNDVFFSSHVIEHLRDLKSFVRFSQSRLTKEGVFMAFCPNGSAAYRQRDFGTFHVTWGGVHPLYLDLEFATQLFKEHPYLILTSDWPYNLDEIAAWDGKSQTVTDARDGYELLIIARPNLTIQHSQVQPS